MKDHYCEDSEIGLNCFHGEKTQRMIVRKYIENEPHNLMVQFDVNFCPICGHSYQPERLSPETSKEDAIV